MVADWRGHGDAWWTPSIVTYGVVQIHLEIQGDSSGRFTAGFIPGRRSHKCTSRFSMDCIIYNQYHQVMYIMYFHNKFI